MPLNLTRPVTCAKCGEKFTRTHGRQKLCISCRPAWVNARAAARAATKPARLAANRRARKQAKIQDTRWQNPGWQAMLQQPCPHHVKLADCTDSWCSNRRDSYRLQGGRLPEPGHQQ